MDIRNSVINMFRYFSELIYLTIIFLIIGCNQKGKSHMDIKEDSFGYMPDGTRVFLYTLTNNQGAEAKITNYGAIVTSLKVPDRRGKLMDVVLGYDNLQGYLKPHPYFGAIVGRYGNRIGKAKFELDGIEYRLAANNGENHLHGGIKGFDKVLWNAVPFKNSVGPTIKMSYLSLDGEEGYPGNLSTTVSYTLTKDNALKIEYTANTDKPTVINLTHHGYFNFTGVGTVLDHILEINADKITTIDQGLIPTGDFTDVTNTAMDFRSPTAIGARINADHQQLKFAQGYDFTYVLNGYDGMVKKQISVYHADTGIFMEVFTDQPGVQFYTGNFLDGSLVGKGGTVYEQRSGFCLETQHFPDSPNKKHFPAVRLNPGETYSHTTIYKFSIRDN
jgi:aldose 1-epimerase